MKNAKDEELESAEESCELWTWICGGLVVVGVLAEFVIAFFNPPYGSPWERWGPLTADMVVLIGVAGEVIFSRMGFNRSGELQRRFKDRALKADMARIELELRLLPRMLTQEQWDFIQGLRTELPAVAIAYETDAETRWFAANIRDAFFAAGISVAMYPRAAEVHSFGTFVFDPNGFDGAKPRTVGPLVELMGMTEIVGSLAMLTEIPSDIAASVEKTRPEIRVPLDTPMIIVGGRFVIPPPHLLAAAKEQARARRAMKAAEKARE